MPRPLTPLRYVRGFSSEPRTGSERSKRMPRPLTPLRSVRGSDEKKSQVHFGGMTMLSSRPPFFAHRGQGDTMSRPFLPIVAAVALHGAMLGVYLTAFHGDLSSLVCVGQKQIGTPPYEAVRVGFTTGGFDGQFYYAIARNPWICHAAVLDVPAYRHLRLLYPALAWALSGGGDPWHLFWALPFINLAAIAGLAWLGVRLARHYGVNVWWGFVLPLAVNDGMPLLRDLTDPLATFTVCGLLASWLLGGRWYHLALWAAAALFSREQNVAVVFVVLAAALATGRYRTVAGFAVALAVWAGWIGLLRAGLWRVAGIAAERLLLRRAV